MALFLTCSVIVMVAAVDVAETGFTWNNGITLFVALTQAVYLASRELRFWLDRKPSRQVTSPKRCL